MAAGGRSRSLRSRVINLEAGETEATVEEQTKGAEGASLAPTNPSTARVDSIAGPSNLANDAHTQPVSIERARLREQARKGKVPSYRVATELVENLKSASAEASQVVKDLWPNLLDDAFRHKAVPDTLDGYDGYDSQMPEPNAEDLHRLATHVKHVGEHMKHVQSCLEEVVERAWVGQAGLDKFISDSDETEDIHEVGEGSQPAPPGPYDTQPPREELSSESEESMGGEAPYEIAAAVAAQGGGPIPGRQLVQKDHVVRLVTVYHKAMQTFTKSKKGVAPSQLIPSKVWQQIYKDYKREFPASTFKEDSLKDHLRASLKDLKRQKESPVDCEEVEDPSQDEELMTRLMATDSWKARNVVQSRMDATESLAPKSGINLKSSTPAGSSTSGQTSSVAPPKVASAGGAATVHIPFKPPTKSQNLKDARQDMAAMLGEFKNMLEGRREDSTRKHRLADGKAALHDAKRQESEERRKALEEQGKMSKINLIKEQKALGLISEEEFVEKCKLVFQL